MQSTTREHKSLRISLQYHCLLKRRSNMSRNFITRSKHFVNDYLSHSGIHGFSYLGDLFALHVVEKFFWLVLICVGVYFSVDFGLESWDRYLHKSTVVSIERDFYYWNTSMPSLTICPIARISRTNYDDYAEYVRKVYLYKKF